MTPALTIPAQRRLRIKLDAGPLVTLATARGSLGLDEESIMELIETRALAWAWDIGLGQHRGEVRLLTKSARGYEQTGTGDNLMDASPVTILCWILAGETKEWITGKRLRHILLCSAKLINELVDEGELRVMPGSQRRHGREGYDLVTRQSVISFLNQRRIQ